MSWYNDLGYKHNPFSIKPTEGTELIGYEKILQRLVYQIKIGNVIFLEGDYGCGKSSILKFIRKQFKKNTLYFNCSSARNIKKAIQKKRTIWRKVFLMKPKRMILLIDEAHLVNSRDFDFLYEYYIMDRIKSIIFAGTDFKTVPFNKAFKSDTKKYKLKDIKNNLALEILEIRMPEQKLVSSQIAKKIFTFSGNNPRVYLENLEDLFRNAYATGKKKIGKNDIEEFFGKK